MRALTALSAERVSSLAGELCKGLTVRHRRVPQTGLGLLTLRDSTRGEAFHLGEFPLAIVEVEVETADGICHAGGAQVMADWADWAWALALCDAVLANDLPGAERVAALVAEGAAIRQRESQIRRSLLDRTHVDFSLLSTTELPEGEERP